MDRIYRQMAALNRTAYQTPSSVYVQHPEWVRISGDRFVLDPGIPEVRDWITKVVTEVVANYAVDGVQFDDYFYAESPGSALNDSQTWRQYGQGFASKADWRRHNTQQLIVQVSRAIKQTRPDVEFGVSPAGVWRNRSFDPAEIEKLYAEKEQQAASQPETGSDTGEWQSSADEDWGTDADKMRVYSCPSCGAQLICEETTAATSCPYCGTEYRLKAGEVLKGGH